MPNAGINTTSFPLQARSARFPGSEHNDLNFKDIEPTMVNYTIFNVVKARYRLLSELFHANYERPNIFFVYNEVIKALEIIETSYYKNQTGIILTIVWYLLLTFCFTYFLYRRFFDTESICHNPFL
jgi:hypothetical protein